MPDKERKNLLFQEQRLLEELRDKLCTQPSDQHSQTMDISHPKLQEQWFLQSALWELLKKQRALLDKQHALLTNRHALLKNHPQQSLLELVDKQRGQVRRQMLHILWFTKKKVADSASNPKLLQKAWLQIWAALREALAQKQKLWELEEQTLENYDQQMADLQQKLQKPVVSQRAKKPILSQRELAARSKYIQRQQKGREQRQLAAQELARQQERVRERQEKARLRQRIAEQKLARERQELQRGQARQENAKLKRQLAEQRQQYLANVQQLFMKEYKDEIFYDMSVEKQLRPESKIITYEQFNREKKYDNRGHNQRNVNSQGPNSRRKF